MIVILGCSGAGKSTLEQEIINKMGYKKMVSHTTRPMREGEVDGVDYHFVSDKTFQEIKDDGMFIETAEYNNWNYGVSGISLKDKSVAVLTPHGLRQFKKFIKEFDLDEEINLISVYLKVDRKSRLIKLIQTRDDIEECYRRSVSDVGMFEGIEDEATITIDNSEYRLTPDVIYDQLIQEFDKLGVKY